MSINSELKKTERTKILGEKMYSWGKQDELKCFKLF